MTTMTAVYDALIAGDIPAEKATAAVEAIEVARDEPWKRKIKAAYADLKTDIARLETRMETRIAGLETRMESGFARLNALVGVVVSLQIGIILLGLGILLNI